jgi:hypothetical protein
LIPAMLLIFWLLSSAGLPIDFLYDHVQHHNFKWLVLVSQSHAYLFFGIWRRPRPNHEPTRDRDAKFGIIRFNHLQGGENEASISRHHVAISPCSFRTEAIHHRRRALASLLRSWPKENGRVWSGRKRGAPPCSIYFVGRLLKRIMRCISALSQCTCD